MNIKQLVDEVTPKFNPDIARGYVRTQAATVDWYVDSVWKAAAESLPAGLTYNGCKSSTPEEAYKETAAKRNGGMRYEFSKSDIYMNQYNFSLHGVPIKPKFICLPFFRDGGLMKIMGSTYTIAPTLADRSISVTSRNIFVPLPRDKLLFHRMLHTFYENGRRTLGYVFWCKLYRDGNVKVAHAKKTVVLKTTIIHYLLARYGLAETIKRLDLPNMKRGLDEESKSYYRKKGYVIFESDRRKLTGYRGDAPPTLLWFAVKPEAVDVQVRNFVASMFYIADHFPDRVQAEYLDHPGRWTLILAHSIFASRERETTLLELVTAHLNSVENYVDIVSKNWFKQDGLNIATFYELLAEISKTYAQRSIHAAETSTSMYEKRFLVHRYVLSDIVDMIFRTVYALQTKFKNKGDAITVDDVEQVFRTKFVSRAIIKLNRSNHPEAESASNPTPCMAYSLTTRAVLQSNISTRSSEIFDPFTMGLDASIAEVGNFLGASKSEPTGRRHLNVYTNVDPSGNIIRNEKFRELLDLAQAQLQR